MNLKILLLLKILYILYTKMIKFNYPGVTYYEYLKATGTQYINSGISGVDGMDIKFQFDSSGSDIVVAGGRQDNGTAVRLGIIHYSSYIHCMCSGNSAKNITFNTNINTIKYKGNTITINGDTSTITPSSTGTKICYIFWDGYKNKFNGKIFYCKLYKQGALVRNYVPCKYEGEYGLWDLVENKFYKNDGTGSFEVGEISSANGMSPKYIKAAKPTGIQFYDYIYSDGNARINTGITTVSGHTYTIKTIQTIESGNYHGASYGCYFGLTSNKNYFDFSGISTGIAADTKFHTFEMVVKPGSKPITGRIDNTSISLTRSSNVGSGHPFGIFALPDLSGYKISGKIMKYQLYDNGQLLRDFVPCTNSNGAAGMYDLVENAFYADYNGGTFTLGNPLKKQSELVDIKKVVVKEPSEYIFYEYLVNSSSGYIKTDLCHDDNPSIEIKASFDISSDTKYRWLFGTRLATGNSPYTFGLYIQSSAGVNLWRGANQYKNTPINMGETFKFFCDKKCVKFNDTTIYISDTTFATTQKSYYFMSLNHNGSRGDDYWRGKIYYIKVWNSGNLELYLVPASKDGVNGFYDKVNKTFYTNSGSGTFTMGPEIKGRTIYEVIESDSGDIINFDNNENVLVI